MCFFKASHLFNPHITHLLEKLEVFPTVLLLKENSQNHFLCEDTYIPYLFLSIQVSIFPNPALLLVTCSWSLTQSHTAQTHGSQPYSLPHIHLILQLYQQAANASLLTLMHFGSTSVARLTGKHFQVQQPKAQFSDLMHQDHTHIISNPLFQSLPFLLPWCSVSSCFKQCCLCLKEGIIFPTGIYTP